MFRMPAPDDPVRKYYDEKDLPQEHDARMLLPRVDTALINARKQFDADSGTRNVVVLVRKPNGDIALIRYKRTGTVLQLWNFGQ